MSIMQHARTSNQQLDGSPPAPVGQTSKSPARPFALIRLHEEQEVDTTPSRRTRRGDFLRAATWAISARLHPKAGETTLRVARDLAARLNADGHVAYCRDAMHRRLAISRRTLERHIAVLRELGLLVWVVHGTRTNTRPPGSGEWAGTATIYAAVVPRAWDDEVGHRIRGHGYHAHHIGFTERGREMAIAAARQCSRQAYRRDTPSCKPNPQRRTAEVGGRKNNTCPPRRARSRARRRSIPEPYRAAPEQAAHAIRVAAYVRPRVPWTQTEGLRRLAFALRPWITAGHSAADLAVELSFWCVPRRPASPAALIMARWCETTDQAPQTPGMLPDQPATPTGVPPNSAFLAAMGELRTRLQILHPPPEPVPDPPDFVIRNMILASLAEANRAWRTRRPEECLTLAEWEAVCDAKEYPPW